MTIPGPMLYNFALTDLVHVHVWVNHLGKDGCLLGSVMVHNMTNAMATVDMASLPIPIEGWYYRHESVFTVMANQIARHDCMLYPLDNLEVMEYEASARKGSAILTKLSGRYDVRDDA